LRFPSICRCQVDGARWCELYRAWEDRLSPTMRQVHPAGERMFVDYAGQTIELIDGRSGEILAGEELVVMQLRTTVSRIHVHLNPFRLARLSASLGP
jgi:transposase